ncbi:zymogen granule membrane protein 16-like [Engraulis encrasicolus]|uniref:zymogen granule membrane protein 16-like n=1 Tax=Engraulis encrasicolus TaxID=184585 RepID=UPI002FCFCC47
MFSLCRFQVKFGFSWAPIVGRSNNDRVEMILFDGEAIIQVSGKFNPSNFVEQVIFVTNRGRFLMAGQPTGLTFNHYPTSSESELLLLSGRFNNGGITSLGAHWGRPGQAVHPPSSNSSDLSAAP